MYICDAEVARMHIANPAAGTNGVTSIGIMSQSSKLATQDNAIHKKLGVSFEIYLSFREHCLLCPFCVLVI